MTWRSVAGLLLAGAAVLAAGCRNTADGAREDARRAAREAQKAADDAKKELDRAAREAKRAAGEAQRAADDARRDMQESAADLNAAKQLLDVRTALAVSKEISSASDISVRSDEAGRTVILSGSVPTAAEKATAGRIARASADGLRVDNRLQVASRP